MTGFVSLAKRPLMKIATYNLNGIRARLPRLLEWLEREQPDVACLQELKCADESLPIADIEAAGYGAVWHGQKGFNGVAILAKGDAPELRRVGLPGDPDDSHSRYIEAEVEGRDRRLALPAQRQSGRHREVRLQDPLDGAAPRPRRRAARGGAAGGAVRRLERGAGGPRRLLGARHGEGRGDAARGPPDVAADRPPGLDRRTARVPSERREALHLLGLYRGLLAARPRASGSTTFCARRRRRTG